MTIAAAAVFCGSRHGNAPFYAQAARDMGAGLARAGIRLIYGGGAVGLMGEVAGAALAAGGAVSGVIPDFLHTREVMHHGVTDLVVTTSMHERKALMFARAEAFLILPGGLGTFDELMEILTWRQLSLHDKPILIVDVGGWARHVVGALDAAIEQGFASPSARELYDVVPDVPTALSRLKHLPPSEPNIETARF
ncbi:lysine decarboxylase [Neoasaia chiangmaiensis NBRC 101099]|uniref:Cytokinin riboside 5'-monophosphate phosphoribohydrolase n=1 Tax=Neoasaia chiangmaiensis TaxID=320497 RepID=A0A1U9KPG7_9PROT|nr:TIGR00730 family Rossman fold protein [Neoasaia chiangmaiensis]AQS87704.1 Rossman fold protein, TIGR00730 family [Neoasaia chiangmaiensis]GBR41803.1 lysine decarboxylase [Neoasaia chiangmaiensis NBRC 101099]GEN14293.1 cytokinin riboside 5'-monophosphate phosphoribohydrolase [Neoasaia chiangmaiensis]